MSTLEAPDPKNLLSSRAVLSALESAFSFAELPETFKALDSKGIRAELGKIRDAANSITLEMDRLYEKQKDAKSRGDAR